MTHSARGLPTGILRKVKDRQLYEVNVDFACFVLDRCTNADYRFKSTAPFVQQICLPSTPPPAALLLNSSLDYAQRTVGATYRTTKGSKGKAGGHHGFAGKVEVF